MEKEPILGLEHGKYEMNQKHLVTPASKEKKMMALIERTQDSIRNNVGGPGGYYAQRTKSDREGQILCYHLYVESKKPNECT